MKKVLALMLSLALAASLVACGSSSSSGGSAAGSSGAQSGDASQSAAGSTDGSSYPESNITLVVPYDAGGASDLMARAYATGLSDELGVNVIVENRTGGSGLVGAEYVNGQDADGYTILYLEGNICLNCAIGNSDLDPTTAFFSFVRTHTNPLIVFVPADSEINNLDDLIAAAKADPGGVTVANSATGGQSDLATYDLEAKGDCVFAHIPYDGAAPAVAACIGKNVDACIVTSADAGAAYESGEVKAIATLAQDRDVLISDVSTSFEQGYEVEAVGWGSFAVKNGTSQEIIDILSEASMTAIEGEPVLQLCEEKGYTHAVAFGDEANEFKDSVYETYVEVARVMGYIE